MRFAICAGALVMLAACSKTDLLNATITRDGYVVERDVAYGSNSRQTLDIYVPEGVKNAPVIVFFYGGSWQFGSKDDYRFLGQALTSKGFITIIANYRLYPEVKFPSFIDDGAMAFRYAHEHIADHGGNPNRMFVAGHSAGAYIAMMVGGDPRYLKRAGGNRAWVKGIVGIAGPYDFLPFTDSDIIDIFSSAQGPATQPINHITQPMPPVLLATGDADDVVLPRNSHNVTAKLRAQKSAVVEKIYPDIGHIDIMLSLAQRFRGITPLLDDMAAFVHNPN